MFGAERIDRLIHGDAVPITEPVILAVVEPQVPSHSQRHVHRWEPKPVAIVPEHTIPDPPPIPASALDKVLAHGNKNLVGLDPTRVARAEAARFVVFNRVILGSPGSSTTKSM